jgi:diguanylate cyclase
MRGLRSHIGTLGDDRPSGFAGGHALECESSALTPTTDDRLMPHAASTTPHVIAGLDAVVDEHLSWFVRWHRALFFPLHAEQTDPAALVPVAFLAWVREAKQGTLLHQPAVDRLINLHEQLHRQARQLLDAARRGEAPEHGPYLAAIERFEDFLLQCRRFERAVHVAGSGIDPLTGLRNRTGLMDELARETARFHRTGRPFCLAMCDLDRFKAVNDTYGHEAGDRALVATARAVNRGIRMTDEAFRLGGEEILILLKETDAKEALPVVERLRTDLANQPIPLADGKTLRITASFGLAESQFGLDPDALLERADQALYAAKNGGRNQVQHWRQAGGPPPAGLI